MFDHQQQALYCFIKSGDVEKEQEARAHLYVKEASTLEGTGKPSDLRKAAQARERAGDLFSGLKSPRQAATQYQLAGRQLSKASTLIRAADLWSQCGQTPQVGREILDCLNAAGPQAFDRLFVTLQLDWITRDAVYWRIFRRFANRYGEVASEQETLLLAEMFPTFDEKVDYLEELGLRTAVDDILTKANQLERLGRLHESRAEMTKAANIWKRLNYQQTLQRLQLAETQSKAWLQKTAEPEPVSLVDAYRGVLARKPLDTHSYYELQEYLRRYLSLRKLLETEPHLPIEIVRGLLGLSASWQARVAALKQCSEELAEGSWPDRCCAEVLGAYRPHADAHIFLVADYQQKKWLACDLTGTVSKGPKDDSKVAVTAPQLARTLYTFFNKAISEIQRCNRDLLLRMRAECDKQTGKRDTFGLKLQIEVS